MGASALSGRLVGLLLGAMGFHALPTRPQRCPHWVQRAILPCLPAVYSDMADAGRWSHSWGRLGYLTAVCLLIMDWAGVLIARIAG